MSSTPAPLKIRRGLKKFFPVSYDCYRNRSPHEQALQFAAEDNVKVLWDKIRATFLGQGEDRKIDAGNELKHIRMKNGGTVGDYIARARGISIKCHSLGLDVSPRELVNHIVRGLNGKFSQVRDILKTQRGKSMEEVFQILREEETTFNMPIKTRMDGINAEAFYPRRKSEKQTRLCYICRKPNHQAKDCYYRNKNSPSTSQRNITQKKNNSSRNGHVFTASHREEKLCDNTWILDSGAPCHMAKESVWFKNISPEVMDIYLADKNYTIMSQGTGNVSAKTVSTKHCNSINLTITDVSYVPQLRCNLLSVTCLMDKGSKYENLLDKRIKKIRTDNGLEFVNEQLDTYLAKSGIFHEKTIPYNSESNGKAERANRVLLERARSLVYESKLPLKFWAEAINCSTQISKTTSSPQTGKIQLPVLELNDIQHQIPVRRSERLKYKQMMSVHLTNNVPNSYFEAKNSANWQNWKLAKENELDSLDKHKVELLDNWNVDVPSWKYPRNLESPRVSSPGFENDSKMMVMFSLQTDSRWTLIWKAPDTRYHQENTIERHRYGGAGWLVWGGIILGSRTDLHVQSVTMTGHIYWDVILEQHAHECLQSEDITRMDWPAYSPDLNPIEHVWDMLGRRIAARQPPPTCLPELRRALIDEWCNISQDQSKTPLNNHARSAV
ncbi:retrovirus-related Pol polyprotein from transposon TNT 1-94 [Trichonephila clavipes]|nr:retrovirus-related Pol polyprotein from transposon TNT 1-94 [Trichonephila clavipes]